jgi:uncharacterized membrane protein
MVLGHTFDALLAAEVRAEPLVGLYWTARGFTAPLFMVVSGWALAVATSRRPERGLAVPRARLPRVLLLLALGYGLRWPGWGVALLRQGDGSVWAHFLAFDALHAIAVAILVTTCALALPAGRRTQAGLLAVLALVAVLLGTSPLAPAAAGRPASVPLLAIAQAVGGTSAFPLFPWVGYFFAGAVLGLAAGPGRLRSALATAAAGAALTAAAVSGGLEMAPGDPRLFAFRLGAVLLLLAALSAIPAALAARARPIGRASLAVYVLHLPIVYGWSTHEGLFQRVGPQLGFASALLAGAAVLLGCLAVARALALAARLAPGAPRWLADRWSDPLLWRGRDAGHSSR